jgi:hypothetical protein
MQPPVVARLPRFKKKGTILLAIASAVTLTALFQSCATTKSPVTAGGKVRGTESLVCPQCKMVAVATFPPYQALPWAFAPTGWYPGWSSSAWGGLARPQTTYKDKCPGCQGAITTFARESKLKHKCSICTEKPFKCPVYHPTT